MRLKGLLVGGLVLAIAFAINAAGGCGKKEESKNPASSALDSLPNANLSDPLVAEDAVNNAASEAESSANSVAEVPSTAEFQGGVEISPFVLKALARSNLSPHQKNLVAQTIGSLRSDIVYTGCPTITDNSSGTTIDITWDAGAGCTMTGTNNLLFGSYYIKGTVNPVTGVVDLTGKFNNYGMTMTCGSETGTERIVLSGSASAKGSGLVQGTATFDLSTKFDIRASVSINCGGNSGSGSAFIYDELNLDGTKFGSCWSVDGSGTQGVQIASGGMRIGVYSDWNGTASIYSITTSTVNFSGRVGWEFLGQKGKVNIKLTDVVVDHNVCWGEPASGTLEVSSPPNSAVMTFDGATNNCGCANWTLNGTQMGTKCWFGTDIDIY